jgi:hydrogenase maturation protease
LADSPNILVLGVGNLLRRDEGFGVHVVRLLSERYRESSSVSIVDGGTAGNSLLGAVLQCDHLILVDVALMREEPGTLCRLEGSTLNYVFKAKQSAHDWSFSEILLEALMLGHAPTVVVIAAQPQDIDRWSPELSPTLTSRVPDAVARVVAEIEALGGILVPNATDDATDIAEGR